MAPVEAKIVEAKLFCSRAEDKTLAQTVKEYFSVYGEGFALLYSPRSAYLATLKSENHFIASSGTEISPVTLREKDWQDVFEARIFNDAAELRWLNRENGEGPAVVLCERGNKSLFNVKPKPVENIYARIQPAHGYLFWGRSTGKAIGEWTQFAEARIGAFFLPLKNVAHGSYAQFRAVEYFGEYDDGNIAVAEERLTEIALA